mgnify:CR=1 FL=1
MSQLSQEEILRYSRHLMIPGVGLEGQRRLKDSSVLIVGTGGLGSPIALYLAAAGVGHIGLVDYDVVESSNLQRQVIHTTRRAGQLKVESARAQMLDLNPHIQVDACNQVFSAANAEQIASGFNLLLDGTDNFPTRYLLNDLAALTGRAYIYGSIFRFEGQVSVFDARRGPCYRCIFPSPPPRGSVPGCNEGGVFGVLPGTIGTLQASEALKLLLGIGEPLIGKLLLYDALEMSFQTIKLRKNPACPVCGEHPTLSGLVDYEQFCGAPARQDTPYEQVNLPPDWQITPLQLAAELRQPGPPGLLDVRDPVELQICRLPAAELIPLEQLPLHLPRLDPAARYVLLCRSGERAARAVRLMRASGLNARALLGGLNAWAAEIDPQMFKY